MSDREPSRYVVGIDLGTTNSALAYIDMVVAPDKVNTFLVPQVVAPSTVEARDTLPSFHYEPIAGEFVEQAICSPWQKTMPEYLVGLFARDHGGEVPARQILSAKSWLCHGGVDRTAAILPWQGAEDITHLSPMSVCARYLRHLCDAWNHAFPRSLMEEQDIIVTVPASFDEVARELTVEAAAQAGLERIVLLEEPQAAFYHWIYQHGDQWREQMQAGETILVCDIGGGTTDFSLIQLQNTKDGALQFHRIAVGDHLILGGDNLDLTLARYLEKKLDMHLSAQQYSILVRRCRYAKERLLGSDAPERMTVNLPGGGSRLIGGSVRIELTRAEIMDVLVDGFLPKNSLSADPIQPESGFREFGLPYAPDPGMTRYLARFLRIHGADGNAVRPDALLLNGGFFAASSLRERLIDVVRSWFVDDSNWEPKILVNEHLYLAVAYGAACYGRVRRGDGERIKAGIPRSYFVGVQQAEQAEPVALCLVPTALEEGELVEIPDCTFEIRIREPVEFPIYCSAFRTGDKPGDLVEVEPETLTALPPIRTVLRSGKKKGNAVVRVTLQALVNETGTLEMRCKEVDGDRSWHLKFDVRSVTQTDLTAHEGVAEIQGFVDATQEDAGRALIRETFAGAASPDGLMKRLEAVTDLKRTEWPPSLLRSFWDELVLHERARARTVQHDIRWMNLTGFCLRPGYGLAVDDWRVARIWQLFQRKQVFPRNEQCRGEWWILWRRICGGLTSNQQQTLAAPLVAGLKAESRGSKGKYRVGAHENAEIWRLLGSLERLDATTKKFLGELALQAIRKKGVGVWNKAALWAVARLGTRSPLYGPLNTLVSPEHVEGWVERLLALGDVLSHSTCFALMQLGRRTEDRYRDIHPDLRSRVVAAMKRSDAPEHYVTLVEAGGMLDDAEMRQTFGDSLPPALRLI